MWTAIRHFSILLILQAFSCWFPAFAQDATATHLYVLHLPGVGGFLPVDRGMIAGLRAGGVGQDIHFYDWTEHDPGIDALHAYDRNQREAAHVADLLATRIASAPHARLVLTSHSGGGAIAVWALENLPANDQVDAVLLMAPALSPDYDLTAALRHVRGKMYVFWSSGDQFILGLGCRICGTMDRKQTDAAGLVGFTPPPTADMDQYKKLDQRPYDPDWVFLGNFGDHIGPMAAPFAKTVLAPLVKGQ
jgi:pimeloyl-ACP methyl ester carboxylesterase